MLAVLPADPSVPQAALSATTTRRRLPAPVPSGPAHQASPAVLMRSLRSSRACSHRRGGRRSWSLRRSVPAPPDVPDKDARLTRPTSSG